jgi:phage terminase large subunit
MTTSLRTLSIQDRAARERLRLYKREPWTMVRTEFKVLPDKWQDQALHAAAKGGRELRIALKACKGPGKTAVLAWLILWFLVTRLEAKILCTSITEANLHANLWPELAKWMSRSTFVSAAFVWTGTRISNRADPRNWFAEARSWPKQANAQQQADALAGHHADHVMAIADESGGMPQAVMVALEQIFTSCVEGILVQAGNPTHTTGPLYRACTQDRALWEVITITGDPDDPNRSPRINLAHAKQQIASYGRDNPWVMVNILGQFPPSSINALLGIEEVEAAMKRHLRIDAYNWAQKRIGVDVARFGDDRTVFFPRQGRAAFRPVILRQQRTTEIAARLMMGAERWGGKDRGEEPILMIDDTGHWGHGVVDQCYQVGLPVVAINYGGKAADPRYKNKRAEMWLEGAKAIKAGAALPYIAEMIPELTEPTYTFVGGVFVLEEKEQIKARLGQSPDLGDAYMNTYALPDVPSKLMQQLRGGHKVRHDADPYAIAGVFQESRSTDDYAGGGRVEHDWDPFKEDPQ